MNRKLQRSLLSTNGSTRWLHRSCRSLKTRALVIGFLCVGLTTPAAAKVCEFGSVATGISPPPSVREDALEDNKKIHVFPEKSGLTLSSTGVVVNANTYGSHNNKTLGTFAVGQAMKVDSDYIHYDPNAVVKRLSGSVVFCEPILGVIASDSDLRGSHSLLGAPGTIYPVVNDNEGIEGGNAEHRDYFNIYKVGGEMRGLSFSFKASADIDTLRVITKAKPPAPVV